MPLQMTLADRRLLHDPRLLPLLFLPWTLLSVCLVKTYQTLHRRRIRSPHSCHPKVLITGFSSPAALSLARAFCAAGHVVVAVDHERQRFTSSARMSRAVHAFYTLAKRQADGDGGLLSIVLHERPDVWISCDDDWAADLAVLKRVLDHQASLPQPLIKCRVVAPDQEVLRLASDQVAFADYVRGLGCALRAPEVYIVKSRHDLHWILSGGKNTKKFLASRLEPRQGNAGVAIVLPRPTINETYNCVAELDISKTSPWILRELIHGDAYQAHVLLSDGQVVSFVVSRPVSSLAEDGTRIAVPPGSPIQKTLLGFTQAFVAALSDRPLTHLTIDFILSAAATDTGMAYRAYPMACSAGPPPLVSLVDLTIDLSTLYLYAASSPPRAKSDPDSHVERCIQRFNGATTPPNEAADVVAIDKSFSSLVPRAAPILTPPNTPSVLASRSPPRGRSSSSHLLPATIDPTSTLKGTYSLPLSLRTHLLAPLRTFLLHPLCGGGPAELLGGLLVLAERVASSRWREERWAWSDLGVELWEWGVKAPVTALWGLIGRA